MFIAIATLAVFVAIIAVIVQGHKSACAKSAVKIATEFDAQEKAIRQQWAGKSNQDHWLFRTSFPNVIKFDKDAALNHELQQITGARRLYAQSLSSRESVAR